MKEAGLTSLPGGGAEVFSTAVRATIAERKLTGQEWLRVHRVAHELGIPSNCTMLYGHVETMDDRIEHLGMLRELQDETGGFLTYIPLAYHPDNNELGEELGRVGLGHDRLRGPAEHRHRPPVPRQHPAREDALAHGDAVPVADRAGLRLRRRRRHGGVRADLSRGRGAHRDAHAVRAAGPDDHAARGSARWSATACTRRCARTSPDWRPTRPGRSSPRRWCTPHETRPHPLDQLLPGVRRHRPRAGSDAARSS